MLFKRLTSVFVVQKAENEVPDLLTKRMKEEKEADRDINPATSAGVNCFGRKLKCVGGWFQS